MKNLLIISLLFFTCAAHAQFKLLPDSNWKDVTNDRIPLGKFFYSVREFDSAINKCDSVQRKYDSLKNVLILERQKSMVQMINDSFAIKEKNFRLNRIRYYLKIVDRDPSQVKFLRSWISRAVY